MVKIVKSISMEKELLDKLQLKMKQDDQQNLSFVVNKLIKKYVGEDYEKERPDNTKPVSTTLEAE